MKEPIRVGNISSIFFANLQKQKLNEFYKGANELMLERNRANLILWVFLWAVMVRDLGTTKSQ